MLDLERVYPIELDLDTTNNLDTSFKFKQFDYGSCVFVIRFKKSGQVVPNIANNRIVAFFKDSSGVVIKDETGASLITYAVRLEGEVDGVLLYVPDEVLKKVGKVNTELVIVEPRGNRITSPSFTFSILESIAELDDIVPQENAICGSFACGTKTCGYINSPLESAYDKTVWVDGVTVVDAIKLNKIEQELENLSNLAPGEDVTAHTHANKDILDGINAKIWTGTQVEYDAIETKDMSTIYFIV